MFDPVIIYCFEAFVQLSSFNRTAMSWDQLNHKMQFRSVPVAIIYADSTGVQFRLDNKVIAFVSQYGSSGNIAQQYLATANTQTTHGHESQECKTTTPSIDHWALTYPFPLSSRGAY